MFSLEPSLNGINTKLGLSFIPNSPTVNYKDSYIVNEEQWMSLKASRGRTCLLILAPKCELAEMQPLYREKPTEQACSFYCSLSPTGLFNPELFWNETPRKKQGFLLKKWEWWKQTNDGRRYLTATRDL